MTQCSQGRGYEGGRSGGGGGGFKKTKRDDGSEEEWQSPRGRGPPCSGQGLFLLRRD